MLQRTNQRIPYSNYLKREIFQSNSSPYYFAYGRTALKIGLLHLELQNTAILVPEYICETVTDVLKSLNIKIIYFPVTENLTPQWTIVESLFTSDIKSILMVHYFGIPQQISDFIQFANRKKILVIEDNSHGSFGIIDNQTLGTFGDIGIASPRKSFPILNGGLLYSKTNITIDTFKLEPQNITKGIFKSFIGIILDLQPKIKSLLIKTENSTSYSDIPNYSIDLASYKILENTKFQLSHRILVYKKWLEWSYLNNLKPLFPHIPETISPLCFPLFFESTEQRERFLHFCKKENIASFLWPDLPVEIKNNKNSGVNMYNSIICLPIYNKMDIRKLENRMKTLKF